MRRRPDRGPRARKGVRSIHGFAVPDTRHQLGLGQAQPTAAFGWALRIAANSSKAWMVSYRAEDTSSCAGGGASLTNESPSKISSARSIEATESSFFLMRSLVVR